MARTDLVPAVTSLVLYKRVEGGGLRLNPWQWGFGAFAPLALIIIDLRLLGGWLMQLAPAAFWTAAILGPIPLALSQRRWGWNTDFLINGALFICMMLALLGALAPILVFLLTGIANVITGAQTIDEAMRSTLISGIALLFTWPLLFTAGAFRRQWRLRAKWRPDYRSTPALIGMAILPALMLSAELADRVWFGGVRAELASREAARVIGAAQDLRAYPVGLMTHVDEVCQGLYVVAPTDIVDPAPLDAQLDLVWGRDAGAVRAEAQKLFGPDAAVVCADALSVAPF